jgi:hypothetical protein
MAAAGAGLAGDRCWPRRGPDGFTQGSTARVVSWPAVGCTWRPRWWPFPVRGTRVLSGGGFGPRASGDEGGVKQVRHAAWRQLVAEAWLQGREQFVDALRDAFRSLR